MRPRVAGAVLLFVFALCPVASAFTSTAPWNQSAYNSIVQRVQAHQPMFPARQCNVLDKQYAGLVRQVVDGADSSVEHTVWYYGDAINAAISDCHTAGGGTVLIPAQKTLNGSGIYYSGAITLLSNVDLRIERGATVKFVRNPTNTYYPLVLTSHTGVDLYSFSPMVYALNQQNIGLTGGGKLDAQYNISPWSLPSGTSATVGSAQVLLGMNDAGVPLNQRIFTGDGNLPSQVPVPQGCPPQAQDWGPCASVQNTAPPSGTTAYQSALPPQFVEFNHSSNILVRGIDLVNTQFWQLHLLNSQYITIKGVTISDSAHLNDDGIDFESSRYGVISGNEISTLDDGVVIKSGRNRDGRELRAPSADVILEDNTFSTPVHFAKGTAAIAVGSEMSGGVHDVFLQHDLARGFGLGEFLYLKTNSYRGGAIVRIYARNSTVGAVAYGLVRFDAAYPEVAPDANADVFDPTIRGVYVNNVNTSRSSASPPFSAATVSRSPVQDVIYTNSIFHTTSSFKSAFANPGSEFVAELQIGNVTLVNPITQASTVYNSQPLGLSSKTIAQTSTATAHLSPEAAGCRVCTVNHLGSQTFSLSGKVNGYATLKPRVQVFLDRDPNPIPVTVSPHGSFQTGSITLHDTQYWYRGQHYLSVNLVHGVSVNTIVFLVAN